jgi:hypothetical protein
MCAMFTGGTATRENWCGTDLPFITETTPSTSGVRREDTEPAVEEDEFSDRHSIVPQERRVPRGGSATGRASNVPAIKSAADYGLGRAIDTRRMPFLTEAAS